MVAASSSLVLHALALGEVGSNPGQGDGGSSSNDMMVDDQHRRLGYCKEKSTQMMKSLRFLLAAFLGTVLLLILSTQLTYRVAVRSIVNRTLIPTTLSLHKDLLLARPGHRPAINRTTTLLSYAAIELGESEERQLISRLLNSSIGSGARSMSSWGTAILAERQRQEAFLKYFPYRYAAHWTEFDRALRSWVQNKRFDPRVMAELGNLVKTRLDRYYNGTGVLQIRTGQPYGSCAVVGNSGILLQKTHGPLIDSHEMVIRLNNARTSGFEDSVGSKTSLAFINSHILRSCARRSECFCHPYGEKIPIIIYICQAEHFMDLALCNASHKAPLLVTDARFDNVCARLVKYYSLKIFVETTGKHPDEWSTAHEGPMFHYSSGMQAVMLALGICEKVSLFGFGKSRQANHHYRTNQQG